VVVPLEDLMYWFLYPLIILLWRLMNININYMILPVKNQE